MISQKSARSKRDTNVTLNVTDATQVHALLQCVGEVEQTDPWLRTKSQCCREHK